MAAGTLAGTLLAGAAAAVLLLNVDRRPSPPTAAPTPTAAPPPLPMLWDAPAFDYPDQDGRRFTNRDLLGHVWVADFIFTQCTTACPVLTARIVLLQRRLVDPSVRFVSFSVDPEHDTPAVLKEYAALWHGDESRWRLLSTGDDAHLHATAAGMRVAVQRSADLLNPILHTNRFVLVDAAGHVRGLYDSTDDDVMARLAVDVRALLGSVPSTAANGFMPGHTDGPAASGQQLFAAVGCLACHSQPRVAPTLAGVAGSRVRLDFGGGTVTADDAYLRESILDPGAKVVAGYPPNMPSYRGHLTDAQVSELVTYLKTLSPPAGPAQQAVLAQAVDPVCHMTIRADRSGPNVRVDGTTYYFCSDACRQRFLRDPSRFAGPASGR
jgi:protein SCO1/2